MGTFPPPGRHSGNDDDIPLFTLVIMGLVLGGVGALIAWVITSTDGLIAVLAGAILGSGLAFVVTLAEKGADSRSLRTRHRDYIYGFWGSLIIGYCVVLLLVAFRGPAIAGLVALIVYRLVKGPAPWEVSS